MSKWEEAVWLRIEARMAEDAGQQRDGLRKAMTLRSPVRRLIADDNQPVRRYLRRLIQSQLPGTVIEEAENGREAVEKVAQTCPDLAILDIAMPVLNGLAATRQIAGINPELPGIVHSMYATPHMEREIRKDGARAVVPKDNVRGLLSVIEQLSQTGDRRVRNGFRRELKLCC